MNYKWNYQPPTLEQREAARALAKDIGISYIMPASLGKRNNLYCRGQTIFPSSAQRTA